jgi:hypothetical protein
MCVQKLIKKLLKTRSLTNLQNNYSEDLPNSAKEVRQRIRNAVASLTIEGIRNHFKELRCRVELCAENSGNLIEYFYIQLSFDFFKNKYNIFSAFSFILMLSLPLCWKRLFNNRNGGFK